MFALSPMTADTLTSYPARTPDATNSTWLDTEIVGDVTVIASPGPRLCGAVADRFARVAATTCRTAPEVVVDLSSVTAIDAAGLRALAGLARVCRSAGGELRLCGPTRCVRLLLAAAGLHRLAEVFPSRRHAILAACPA